MAEENKGRTGIRIAPGASNVTIRGNTIVGADRGIIADGQNARIENNRFLDVGTAVIGGAKSSGRMTGSRTASSAKPGENDRASIGRTRPSGPPLPALCGRCGSIFGSRKYVFGGAYWSLWDNTEECTECGYPDAKLSEGIFDLTGETIRILSAPDITRAMIKALVEAATDVLDGNISSDEALQAISQLNRPLGEILRKWAAGGAAALTMLVSIVGAYYGYTGSDYGRISMELSREQRDIAKEGLALQKQANESQDAAMERVLGAMRTMRFTPHGIVGETKPDAKAQSAECRPPSKPKHRHVKRKAMKDRRACFNPR